MKYLMSAKWNQMMSTFNLKKIYSCYILQVVANVEGSRTCKPQNNGVALQHQH